MIDLTSYSNDLVLRNGIFFASKDSDISYPETGNDDYFAIEDNSFWFIHRNNCITTAVKNYSNIDLFFDIGGGNGFVSKALEEKGIATVLVEPGIGGCRNAQKRNIKNIVCSTLENASFKKNVIPSIGLFDVIEHIEDDKGFLTSIYSYLQDDGFVYITVPAFDFLWSNEDVDAGHFRRYTLNNLEKRLKTEGFIIKQSTYIFSILPVAVFLCRTIPSKIGFNKKSNLISKHTSEHSQKKGVLNTILNKVWNWELSRIDKGRKIPMGGSCFVVAQKKSS
ncbi:MAG: class I SAM-dependent methyltransferase [Flavobacterium sp.]|nr:class I SAM-dependent methyltransferase [Flavobacterium sp.]